MKASGEEAGRGGTGAGASGLRWRCWNLDGSVRGGGDGAASRRGCAGRFAFLLVLRPWLGGRGIQVEERRGKGKRRDGWEQVCGGGWGLTGGPYASSRV
jgi:hypothetical protein